MYQSCLEVILNCSILWSWTWDLYFQSIRNISEGWDSRISSWFWTLHGQVSFWWILLCCWFMFRCSSDLEPLRRPICFIFNWFLCRLRRRLLHQFVKECNNCQLWCFRGFYQAVDNLCRSVKVHDVWARFVHLIRQPWVV